MRDELTEAEERLLRECAIENTIMGRQTMSRCNFCTLRDIVKFATVNGREVYTVPVDRRTHEGELWADAMEVYTCDIGGSDYTWIAMLLKIPERCAC